MVRNILHAHVYLLESDCHTSDDIIMGPSLKTWEYGTVDLLLIVILYLLPLLVYTFDPFTVEDETSSGTTEGLVCCRGNNIGVLKWTWVHLWVGGKNTTHSNLPR